PGRWTRSARPRSVDLPEPSGAHPRPQRRRNWWRSLDGPWDFALEAKASWRDPSEVAWDRVIQVPFAPETEASGIHDTGYHEGRWYARTVKTQSREVCEHLVHA